MNTREQYQPRMIAAARQVLLELAFIFEDQRADIVFVGGVACALLFSQDIDPHDGTIDVDIALDPIALAESGIETLEEKLLYANYQQDALREGEEPRSVKKFRWFRTVHVDNGPAAVEVAVDLLSGEYDDNQRHKTAREVQGLHPSPLRDLDLAFLDPHLVPLSGQLPDGSWYETKIQVCSPASLLAMKGIAIADRKQGNDKDAFDIDYILRRYNGGPDALARVLQIDDYWNHGLVQEGLRGIAQAFRSWDALGPTSTATQDRFPDAEERAIEQQGSFLRVQRLLRLLGM